MNWNKVHTFAKSATTCFSIVAAIASIFVVKHK
ncbi:hypothetical protein QFZ77_007646 [Paenibacillus sp. V4I3]|nr:hypothetical protein [Paenibacillus sp. V4I3]